MRQWFINSRDTFRSLREARQSLLKKTDGLSALPFRERLWSGHLFFAAKFVEIETASAWRVSSRKVIKLYCRSADRFFGGDRYARYLVARDREAQHAEAMAQYFRQKAFDLTVRREALVNPVFAPQSDKIQ